MILKHLNIYQPDEAMVELLHALKEKDQTLLRTINRLLGIIVSITSEIGDTV
jgi:hypothetical protein